MQIVSGFDEKIGRVYALMEAVYAQSDSFASSFRDLFPRPAALGRYLKNLRAKEGALLLIAREGEELLGYLYVEPRNASRLRHTADLNMGLRQAARGKGLGKKLLQAALAALKAQGVVEILYLMVRAENAAAVRLYERSGFEALARLERDSKVAGNYYTGVLMRRFI